MDIELVNVESFDKPLTITLPYQDADNDGYEDSTGIPESKIAMYVYDEDLGKWQKLYGNTVNTTENTVTAQTPHLSNFGLFSSNSPSVVHDDHYSEARVSFDGGGGCFISTARAE